MTHTSRIKDNYKFFFIILLATLIVGSASLVYPFGRDQGIYAYAGKLILEGKINYKYLYDLKPPGVHFAYALGELITGGSMFGLRIFEILFQFCTSIVIFLVFLQFRSNKGLALFSSITYCVIYFRLDYWQSLQAESFMNLPFTLSIYFLIRYFDEGKRNMLFYAGILFGIVVIFKYTIIIFIPIILIIFLCKKKVNIKFRNIDNLFFILGFSVILILIFLIYSLTGSLKEFWDIQFTQIPTYTRIAYVTDSPMFMLENLLSIFFHSAYAPLMMFSIVYFLIRIYTKTYDPKDIILWIWQFTTIVNLIIQWKFYHYHFIVFFPPFVLAFVLSLNTLFYYAKQLLKKYTYPLFGVVIVTYIFFLSKPYYENFQDLFFFLNGKKTLKETYIEKGITQDSAFMIGSTFKAIDKIKSLTDKTDRIYLWGFDPLIYYLSDRECASRFIYNFPLYWKGNIEPLRQEFLDSLINIKPKLILISENDPLYFLSGYHKDSKQILIEFKEFQSLIDNNYRYYTKVENFSFYVLN